jgi:AAA15 family ATPase/GTPase
MPTLAAVLNKAIRLDSLPKNEKERSLSEITKLANCFDESIKSISINTSNNNVSVEFEHENFNKKVNIMQESAGTRELFSYMEDLLNALRNGGVVVYDETNRYYHPDVELALLSLFKDKEFNLKNAQLFFTSHNHETFDLLEQDQAHIVEKMDTSTTVFKLSEVEDLQKRENLKKKYRLGMFGGVPDIIGLEYNLKQLL